MGRCLVIGAGIGGLTAAAVLAREGMEVTVLEAQVVPGGCASTFYHRGYKFDAGATLAAGFYPGGPMDLVSQGAGIQKWPYRPAEVAMLVHMPGGQKVIQWSDERRWEERRLAFGPQGVNFWKWQEQTADAMWDLALRLPLWPPQSLAETARLIRSAFDWESHLQDKGLPARLIAEAIRPVSAHLAHAPENLRLFVDAQLLISAQATGEKANALYGASAMDLSRRGVVDLEGGMGAIADGLVRAVRQNGGKVHFRQEASRLIIRKGQIVAIETQRGETFLADVVIANLPPANVALLMGEIIPRIKPVAKVPQDGWGAFIMYIGVDGSTIRADLPLHHQVIAGRPLAEGNSIFMSFSPDWDQNRAPIGERAVTISTHTRIQPWWETYEQDKSKYEAMRAAYAEKVINNAEVALPGFRQAIRYVLTGTPVTFKNFTRRVEGWVGGFPQTHLLRAWAPRLGKNLWMVGDSVFPGQSMPATALGGLRVARQILSEVKYRSNNLPSWSHTGTREGRQL